MVGGNLMSLATPRGEADRMAPAVIPVLSLLLSALTIYAMGLVEGINTSILLLGGTAGVVYLARTRFQNARRKADAQSAATAAEIARINAATLERVHQEYTQLRLRFDSYMEQTAEGHREFDARLHTVNVANEARVKRIRDGYEAFIHELRAEFDARIRTVETERDDALHSVRNLSQDALNRDRPRPKEVLQIEATLRAIEHTKGQPPCPDVEPPLTS